MFNKRIELVFRLIEYVVKLVWIDTPFRRINVRFCSTGAKLYAISVVFAVRCL